MLGRMGRICGIDRAEVVLLGRADAPFWNWPTSTLGRRRGSRVYFSRNVFQMFTLRSGGVIRLRPLVLLSLSALLSAPLLSVSAQQPTPAAAAQQGALVLPLVPGARVRVSASTLVMPLMANYLEMRGDTAVFIEDAAGRGLWTFTVDQITKLEQSRGEKRGDLRYIGKSALIGVPIGSFLFWGTTGIIKPSDKGNRYNRKRTAITGAVVGAAVGALVGTRFTSERWMSLPVPRRLSFVPRPRGGVEVGLGFSF